MLPPVASTGASGMDAAISTPASSKETPLPLPLALLPLPPAPDAFSRLSFSKAGTEMPGMENAENTKLDSEEIERLMEELEATLEEIDRMEQMGELEEVATGVQEDMDPEDLKLLKKKHRSKELKEIMEADMKYLKALFYQLEKERRENASGAGGSGNSASGNGISVPASSLSSSISASQEPPFFNLSSSCKCFILFFATMAICSACAIALSTSFSL